jgi:hypothetical protein
MIDPNAISTIRVDQLAAADFNLTDNIPHEVGQVLKRGTVQQLADLIATQIETSGGVGYLPISVTDGQQLPDVPTEASFFLCGKGTFLNINGYPDIVCTEELNAIMSVTDHWEIAVEIPIEVNPEAIGIAQTINEGVLDSAPSQDAVYQALHQYLNSIGSFHYADEATQTTPISVTSGVETLLTNDSLGSGTNVTNAPYGVPTVWDAVNNQFDFSSLSIGDLVHIRPDLLIDLTGTNTSYEIYMKLAIGTASEWILDLSTSERKSTSEFKKNAFIGFDIENEDTRTAPSKIFIKTDANATVKVNGWFVEVLRKNINITNFEDTNAVHKTGDEVISGTKTFKEPLDASGVVTINGDEIKIANISPVESVRLTPVSIIKQKAGVDYTYSLPDKSGTVAMTSDIPTTPTLQQVTTAGNTTSNKIVSNYEGADPAIYVTNLGGNGILSIATEGAAIVGTSYSGAGGGFSSEVGKGANISSSSGIGAEIYSDSGIGAKIYSSGGTGINISSFAGVPAIVDMNVANTSNIVEFKKDGANQAFITHDGNLTAKGATLSTAPTTSAGTFDVLTRNTTSGIVEKKASSFFQTALTNPITGTGVNGQVAFWNGANSQTGSNNLFWDATNNRLRINQATDAGFRLDVNGTARITSTLNTDADAVVNGVNIGRGAGNVATNTRVGQNALNANTTGNSNTANGVYALFANTTGGGNTANGVYALFANTTGDDNTANGVNALFANTTGGGNTANGYYALVSNTTGNNNTANGVQALQNNTTGGGNTANGYYAGRYISDGTTALTISNDSVFIGTNTRALADNQTNQIVIGTSAIGLGSNTTVLGNSSTTDTAIYGRLLSGTTTPIASAQVQIDSTTRGFLPPRMTTAQINAISSPAVGLVVYNTTLDVLCYRDSVGWKKVTSTIM